jgi:putative exporter of polyketide antibiotics
MSSTKVMFKVIIVLQFSKQQVKKFLNLGVIFVILSFSNKLQCIEKISVERSTCFDMNAAASCLLFSTISNIIADLLEKQKFVGHILSVYSCLSMARHAKV